MRGLWINLGIIGAILITLIARHDQGSILGIRNDQFATALYLGIWGTLIGAAIIPRSGGLGAAARNGAIWLLIILFLMAGYVYRFELQDVGSRLTAGIIPGSPVSSQSTDGRGQVTIVRNTRGQFEANGHVNGNAVNFLVDTGASTVVLTHADAIASGIDINGLAYSVRVSTANGDTMAAPVTLSAMDIGSLSRDRVSALVARNGDLDISLLGMNFLKTLWGFEIRGDRLVLTD
jgi:aspartyl protease family protein